MSKTVTRADLIETVFSEVSSKMPIKRSQIRAFIENIFDVVSTTLREGEEVLISGFGKFECVGKRQRRGRNPKTAEAILLPEHNVIVFRPSKKFRQELNPDNNSTT